MVLGKIVMANKISWGALFVALVALALGILRPSYESQPSAKKETTFERVMRTHTLRCGYAVWNPILYKDLKTGELRGTAHDIMEAVGKRLDLRIDWAEETGWSTLVEGLATHRYDAICVALGKIAPRAKVIDFSTPVFYTPAYIVVRQEENRFSKNDDLNDPAYSFSLLEGEASSFIVPIRFPKAQRKFMPQNADVALVFEEVAFKKADAAITPAADFEGYNKANPGKLRILDRKTPLQSYTIAFGLPQNDVAMKTMIDTALAELMDDGTIAAAINAYALSSDMFVKPIQPYQLPLP